jgi:pimeloyl-ACP methyl ester carboxylesterase
VKPVAVPRSLDAVRASLVDHPLVVARGEEGELTLRLRRVPWKGGEVSHAVLLLHGGNSSGDTFLLPDGGLASHLSREGLDVWLLEWRGSPYVLREFLKGPVRTGTIMGECRIFSVDNVAALDIPAALEFIRDEIGDGARLGVLGHCLSGGALSMAIAAGYIEGFGVTDVVLSTLGLFFEVPWDGWVKVEDFVLERVLNNSPECRTIDPTQPEKTWPADMREAIAVWPSAWKPGGGQAIDDVLRRVSFMVGQPWSKERLVDGLHSAELVPIFGPFHLGLFIHTGQMVRRAFAARFDRPDVIDRARLPHGSALNRDTSLTADYMLPEHFKNKTVTLLAAADNRVWHRDAIDLMYEWLCNEAGPNLPARFHKEVFPGYNLQELFWGVHAAEDVYPRILNALTRR